MEERWVYDTFYRVQEALCALYAVHANLQPNSGALCSPYVSIATRLSLLELVRVIMPFYSNYLFSDRIVGP